MKKMFLICLTFLIGALSSSIASPTGDKNGSVVFTIDELSSPTAIILNSPENSIDIGRAQEELKVKTTKLYVNAVFGVSDKIKELKLPDQKIRNIYNTKVKSETNIFNIKHNKNIKIPINSVKRHC